MNVDQINCFSIGQKKRDEKIVHWLAKHSRGRQEKGQRKERKYRSERARTHIAFKFLFLRRQTHTHASTCHRLVRSRQNNNRWINIKPNRNITKINQVNDRIFL